MPRLTASTSDDAPVAAATASISPATTTALTSETTPIIHPVLKNDLKYLIIPLIVMVLVMILSALVYLMAKRRRLEFVRENLMRLYEFDSNENEWETPLLSSDDNNRKGYDYTLTHF